MARVLLAVGDYSMIQVIKRGNTTNPNTAKKWLRGTVRSFTVWFNGITGTLTAMIPFIPEYLPEMKPYLTQKTYLTLLAINAIGNILLRIKTNKSLAEKGQ